MRREHYWNSIYQSDIYGLPKYDGWLDKYLSILHRSNCIIDLGCGSGVDTIELSKHNIRVLSCDISNSALLQLKKHLPDAEVLCFNMAQGLPFESESIDVIISDLSLHYFDLQTTKKIGLDIYRVLRSKGMLLSRVNSIDEYIFQQNDTKLEENYYFTKGYNRRYFSIEDINEIFGPIFSIRSISESTSNKYYEDKHLIEFVAMKDKSIE